MKLDICLNFFFFVILLFDNINVADMLFSGHWVIFVIEILLVCLP